MKYCVNNNLNMITYYIIIYILHLFSNYRRLHHSDGIDKPDRCRPVHPSINEAETREKTFADKIMVSTETAVRV